MQNTNRGRRGHAYTQQPAPTKHKHTHTYTYTRKRVWKNHRLTGVKMKLQHRE